jgi:hypothetical protein
MSPLGISKSIFSNSTLLAALGSAFFLFAGFLNTQLRRPIIQLSKQETALNINNNLLLYGSAGNKMLFTDLIWIQTLIESDIEHYKKKDLNNWLFLRFNTIAVLDPKFYENYYFGGQFLGIVKDDLEGANVIYQNGLEHFPDDYNLNYNAGFLNYYEMGNFEAGLRYLTKIKNHPKAPIFITSIINKLQFEITGDKKSALALLYENYRQTKDPTLRNKLEQDIYALKATIDLECLNSNQRDCDQKDAEGRNYLRDNEGHKAPKSFRPFKLFRDKKKAPEDESSGAMHESIKN